MKLKSFSYLYCLLIIFLYFSPLKSEEKIDIWNSKVKKQTTEDKETGPSSADKETGPSSAASSTISSHASFTDEQYTNVKQVLHDLQTASAKPEVYLKRGRSSLGNDGKNTRLHIPPDFYGRKSELSLLLHSLGTVLRFGQPVMVSVSGYAVYSLARKTL